MGRFASRRLLQMLFTLLIATFVFFSAVTVLPGDPVRALFGFRPPPPELYEAIRAEFHLDEPFLVQYGLFLSDLARGDLGHSYPISPFGQARQGPPVSRILEGTLPVSLRILAATIVAQLAVGLAIGVAAAVRRRTVSDGAIYAVAILLASIPVIVTGYALQAFVGFEVSWLATTWVRGAGWTNYVQPVAALAGASAAYVLLLSRTELRAVLRQPYVRAAVARGVGPQRVVGVHALRASLIPVVTFVTANLGNLITGLVVVEGIFNVPGFGGVLFTALQRQDRALLVVMITLILVAVVVTNTLADIAYSVIDPRIRLEDER